MWQENLACVAKWQVSLACVAGEQCLHGRRRAVPVWPETLAGCSWESHRFRYSGNWSGGGHGADAVSDLLRNVRGAPVGGQSSKPNKQQKCLRRTMKHRTTTGDGDIEDARADNPGALVSLWENIKDATSASEAL